MVLRWAAIPAARPRVDYRVVVAVRRDRPAKNDRKINFSYLFRPFRIKNLKLRSIESVIMNFQSETQIRYDIFSRLKYLLTVMNGKSNYDCISLFFAIVQVLN